MTNILLLLRNSGLNVKLKKSIWRYFALFFFNSQTRIVTSSSNTYSLKFQYRIIDNKAYRTVRTSYVNCMLKLNFNELAAGSVCHHATT